MAAFVLILSIWARLAQNSFLESTDPTKNDCSYHNAPIYTYHQIDWVLFALPRAQILHNGASCFVQRWWSSYCSPTCWQIRTSQGELYARQPQLPIRIRRKSCSPLVYTREPQSRHYLYLYNWTRKIEQIAIFPTTIFGYDAWKIRLVHLTSNVGLLRTAAACVLIAVIVVW